MKNVLIFFVLLTVASPPNPEIEIKLVQPRYFQEDDFKRIPEYLTGKEFSGRRLIVRTQPAQRAGLYFILTLSRSAAALPNDTKVRIELLLEGEPRPKSFTLEIPKKRPFTRDLFMGLTGSHWPHPDIRPLAWNVSLVGPSDEIIDQKESFLWE